MLQSPHCLPRIHRRPNFGLRRLSIFRLDSHFASHHRLDPDHVLQLALQISLEETRNQPQDSPLYFEIQPLAVLLGNLRHGIDHLHQGVHLVHP